MDPINHFIKLLESIEPKIKQEPLKYERNELDPVISEQSMDYHFGKLAKRYVERYNKGEGDPEFNLAGAKLHNILFAQFKEPTNSNKPVGKCLDLIKSKHGDFDNFREKVIEMAMGLQGSGWIYMNNKGEIKEIKNHQYRESMRIALLIDCWEHSWFTDYGPDKNKYLENIWKIIDWDFINTRL